MLPNVEHGCDFALDVTSPGESEGLSGAVKGSWVMSVRFVFTRGVVRLCILSDFYLSSTNVRDCGRH